MRTFHYLILPIAILFCSCSDNDLSPTEDPIVNETLFTSSESAVFESPLGLAADPSVLQINDTLFMYYSAENFKIGVVFSTDKGITWINPNNNSEDDYPAFRGTTDQWDRTIETIDVLAVGDEYWMYYCGYIEGADDNNGIVSNYEIGLAISTNGIDFIRHPESVISPILGRDISNLDTDDRHAMTSPGVVLDDGIFYMIYAGWNVANEWTGPNAGIRILGATSTDGINWTKLNSPLILPSEVTHSPDINEASLLKAPDGYWYIPFSTSSSIGIARSLTFTGPYDIYRENIVDPNPDWSTEVTAPDGFIEDGKMKLWYHGVKEPTFWPWVIGYTEADFPLAW